MLIIQLVLMVAMALLAKPPESAKPSEVQVTTAEAGRPIPVIYGRVRVPNANVTWWGDVSVMPIRKKTGGFFGLGAKTYTVGYKYHMAMQAAVCWGPIYGIHNIYAGDTPVFFTEVNIGNPVDHALLTVDNDELFGGDEKGGGMKGLIDMYYGLDTQLPNDYLASHFNQRDPNQQGAPPEGARVAPGYPSLCYFVFRGGAVGGVTVPGFYFGTQPYPKPLSFELSRYPSLPSGGSYQIGQDANPACMIYDMVTSRYYGPDRGGITPGKIDVASFASVAALLQAEGAGMSWCIDGSISMDEFLAEIKRTCNIVFYKSPVTGLYTLEAIRGGYDVSTLPEFTVSDFADGQAPEWSRGSWADTFNAVKVNYIDRAKKYKAGVAQAVESANFATQDERKALTLTMKAVMNKTFAQFIAGRQLRALSFPVAQFTLYFNRKAWALHEGSLFKLTWIPPEGPAFVGMVLRVTGIKTGTLHKGAIEVQAVEDVFGLGSTAYIDPDDTGWNDEIVPPAAPVAKRLVEVPYQVIDANRWVFALATRGDPLSATAQVWTDNIVAGSYAETGSMPALTPSGPLTAAYSFRTAGLDTVGFTVDGNAGRDIASLGASNTDAAGITRGDNLALIDDELVSWGICTDNGDGTFTFAPVLRGVMDTVPVTHSSAARVWFISQGVGLTDQAPYTSDRTVNAKILPQNPLGTYPLATASVVSLITASRATSPNPPGKAQINALGYAAWPTTTLNDAAFTWAHRNRAAIGVNTALINQDAAGPPYVIEGDLTIEVIVGGTVKHTYTGQTGTSLTYTAAQRLADDTDGSKLVQLRISPKQGAYNGTVRTEPSFQMTGLGMCLGQVLGGVQG